MDPWLAVVHCRRSNRLPLIRRRRPKPTCALPGPCPAANLRLAPDDKRRLQDHLAARHSTDQCIERGDHRRNSTALPQTAIAFAETATRPSDGAVRQLGRTTFDRRRRGGTCAVEPQQEAERQREATISPGADTGVADVGVERCMASPETLRAPLRAADDGPVSCPCTEHSRDLYLMSTVSAYAARASFCLSEPNLPSCSGLRVGKATASLLRLGCDAQSPSVHHVLPRAPTSMFIGVPVLFESCPLTFSDCLRACQPWQTTLALIRRPPPSSSSR
jgi:hypothetical protein